MPGDGSRQAEAAVDAPEVDAPEVDAPEVLDEEVLDDDVLDDDVLDDDVLEELAAASPPLPAALVDVDAERPVRASLR
ncbi:hypothetical protein [Cellulomonas phragmiteti]|uniref:Uncharacterized protein n=1 Tax=Cellulomonas phragmiteti TaxID=478780 RepID=A0ABQ4DI86_9CELL|nr:hypothetical protein [Cellulomonas phragmiteti]GIG38707.1 hypothetical protein Cph01nite_04690 [Cellulomonas phragmiteti]